MPKPYNEYVDEVACDPAEYASQGNQLHCLTQGESFGLTVRLLATVNFALEWDSRSLVDRSRECFPVIVRCSLRLCYHPGAFSIALESSNLSRR